MEEILRRLQLAIRKTSQLETQVMRLRDEKAKLEERVEELREQLTHNQSETGKLQERYDALKFAKSLGNEEEKAQLQEQIDRYLKEIDICLEVLSD